MTLPGCMAPDGAEPCEAYTVLRKALEFIAEMKGMTLIAPSMGPDGDEAHQIGAAKAFNQAADIAINALKQ